MTIELPSSLEAQLQDLAQKEGRNIGILVEEAVRQYLEAMAITDLGPDDIAEVQVALASELPSISACSVRGEPRQYPHGSP